MVNQARIAVLLESEEPAIVREAQHLAEQLHLPLISDDRAADHDLVLARIEDRLELREPGAKRRSGLSVDLTTLNPTQAARRGGFSKNQPLARAIGRQTQSVLDATAGMGHDAALLACIGFKVLAVERSPILAALLQDGLARALNNPELAKLLAGRLEVRNADARDVLRQSTGAFDAVYIDPMFPAKRKSSALAKKSIRLVRALVGDDADAGSLLEEARHYARRVIVKRPNYAQPLHQKPTAQIQGKLVRYDIYVAAAGPPNVQTI